MPAGGLGVEQITKNRQRFLHDGGKVHNSGHRGRLLSTTSTCGIMDGPSILRGATDFAKLQIFPNSPRISCSNMEQCPRWSYPLEALTPGGKSSVRNCFKP